MNQPVALASRRLPAFGAWVDGRLLGSSLDKRHPAAVESSFPLALTLSLGEREQPPRDLCVAFLINDSFFIVVCNYCTGCGDATSSSDTCEES